MSIPGQIRHASEVGLHLELAALIDFRAPGIITVVVPPTPFVTFAFAIIVIMILTATTAVTEQNNIGNLVH